VGLGNMFIGVPILGRAIVGCVVLALLPSCEKKLDGEAYFKSQAHITAPPELLECARVVNDYVIIKRLLRVRLQCFV
jgi:hypothetical protein